MTRSIAKFLREGVQRVSCVVVFERGFIDDPDGPEIATRLTAAQGTRGGGRLTAVQPVDTSDERITSMHLYPAGASDRAEIELLLDAAFEPGRHTRTAYRLREGVAPYRGLSLVARENGRLVGSIQYWPCELWDGAEAHPLTLLGPVAVAPDLQGTGLGKRLMRASLEVADACGHDAIVLIGDPEYYGRFGFRAAPTAGWSVPGPVERHRLLVRLASGLQLPEEGELRSISSVPAWAGLALPVFQRATLAA